MTYSLLSRKRAIANRQHRCTWCCHPILTASHYLREKSTYDGHFQDFAWHEACRKYAEDYFDDYGVEEFTSGMYMPFHALYQLEVSALSDAQEVA